MTARWRTPFVVLLCGTLVMMIAFGVRMTYGLWLAPASESLGWGIDTLSFAMALQALIWGVATPVAGAIADRRGTGRVVAGSGLIFAAGLLVMANARTAIEAILGIGVLTGIAMGGMMAPIVLTAISRVVADERKRGVYAGIAAAGGSSGQVVLVPVVQTVLDVTDWTTTLAVLAGIAALAVPLAAGMATGRPGADSPAGRQSLGGAVVEAVTHRGYLLLSAGYFVCGFQTLFIATHLPAMLREFAVSPAMGAWAISLIGLFNILGCLIWGALGGRRRKKYLLAWLYILRALAMAAFVLLPVSELSVGVFAAVMGLLWLGTVPLTGGLVAQIFGTGYMATLFGLAFVSHQLGSFIGVWAGGWLFEATGSYMAIWWTAVLLGVIAAACNLPVDDRPVMREAAARAGSAG